MSEKVRYYVDEHVSKAVIHGLRQRGVDVLTVPEAGMLGAADEEHLKLARNECRVLFTQDDDFLRLSARGVEHSGIVYAPQGKTVSEILFGLMLIYQVLDSQEMRGQVEFL